MSDLLLTCRRKKGTVDQPETYPEHSKTKAVLSQRIKLPIKIAERKTSKCGKRPEMYILHSVAKNSYVCGQKQSQSSSYRENIKAVAKEIEEGKITTVKAAREWLSGRGK